MLTAERLREVLDYDWDTGVFRWKKLCHPTITVGAQAGCLDRKKGYLRLKVDGRYYYAHRLAWFWVYGTWPEDQIDRVNSCRSDNRIENLRQASNAQNGANRGAQRNNTHGTKGVSAHKSGWVASVAGKYVGLFPTKKAAHIAYGKAAQQRYGEFARTV